MTVGTINGWQHWAGLDIGLVILFESGNASDVFAEYQAMNVVGAFIRDNAF